VNQRKFQRSSKETERKLKEIQKQFPKGILSKGSEIDDIQNDTK
jgi:hypothetical protein